MGRRLHEFWRGPSVDRALALLGFVGAGGTLWLCGQVIDMAANYPVPLALVSVTCFSLGALASYLAGHDELQRKKWDREIEELRTDQMLSDRFRHAAFGARLAIYEMYRTGRPFLVERRLEGFESLSSELDGTGYVVYEELSDGLLFDLRNPAREFLGGHPELLERIASEWEELHHCE
ncbi:hypothetical protein AAK967_00715 [Atopobiaceae bacterium 24-176]